MLRRAGDRQTEDAEAGEPGEPRPDLLQPAGPVVRDEDGEGDQATEPGRQRQQVQTRRREQHDDQSGDDQAPTATPRVATPDA